MKLFKSTMPGWTLMGTWGLLAFGLAAAVPSPAAAVTFSVFTDPHTNPSVCCGTIGFAYAGDMFVGSVQKDGTGALYSTDLTGGNVQIFAPGVSLAPSISSEHFVASSLGVGGFPSRDVYVAAGNTVVHISHDGTTSSTFATMTLPSGGSGGFVRGILFDAVGTFGHDMLVTTNTGNIFRVNSLGTATLLASVGVDTEGLDVAPLGAGFGAFDGQLIVASEGDGHLRAISPTGTVADLGVVLPVPEELTFVPLDLGSGDPAVEGFYGANYTPNVLKAGPGEFAGLLGDVIVTTEFGSNGPVWDVHWNGSGFVVTQVGNFPNQPEDGIFVTAAIIRPTVPEPGSLLILGTGLAGLPVLVRRARRSS